MNQTTSFSIVNDSDLDMVIVHEPEAFEFNLPVKQEVIIETDSCLKSIALNVALDNGQIFISILGWKNYYYRVLHNGEDAFEKYLT